MGALLLVFLAVQTVGLPSYGQRDPVECYENIDCINQLFCSGNEKCLGGKCVAGVLPCNEGQICIEAISSCITEPKCFSDSGCDNGIFCDGIEHCLDGVCQPGSPPCRRCNEVSMECQGISSLPERAPEGIPEVSCHSAGGSTLPFLSGALALLWAVRKKSSLYKRLTYRNLPRQLERLGS